MPILGFLILVLLSSGCSSTTIFTDWDSEVDFSVYTSVALVPDRHRSESHRPMNPLVGNRVDRAVLAEFTRKGWQTVPASRADLIVITHTAVREKVQVVHTGYVGPRRWYRGWGWGTSHVQRYREGSLVVDLVDRQRKALVWRGIAEGALSAPNPSDDAVAEVVARLLREFPPQE